MSTQSPWLDVERRHVKALIDLLDTQAGEFLSDAATGSGHWRLYFADADVLSTFVDGKSHDPVFEWSSLLSLCAHNDKKRHEASPAAVSLANVLGQAVVRYLFGAFRKTAEIQRCRIFITPEHEREFKAIVRAMLYRQAQMESGWLDKLRDAYLDLSKHNGHADTGSTSARNIVQLLESQADGGAEDRAFTLLRDAISPLSTHILAPPEGEARPFLFMAADPGFCKQIISSRLNVWQAFVTSLSAQVRDIEDLLSLKRIVFEAEDGVDGEPKRFAFYRSRVLDWLQTRNAPESLHTRKDLEIQIKIAVRQSADLAAIAKIDALGQWLNHYRSPPAGKRWETVLISGSSMLFSLLAHWPGKAEPAAVKLMHPLALLRRVDLWDPAGTRRLRDEDYLDQPHEFALSLIFRNSKKTADSDTENVEAFLSSLRSQLDLVVAREAEVGDRGLAHLRRMLEVSEGFDRKDYQEAVRDLVTTRFVQTYRHLTELFPGISNQLPACSLPSLDLPHSKSAMHFMAEVRGTMLQPQPLMLSSEDLEASIKQDPTGYSALLASAIGYMARGSTWLPAAQTMSATAVLLAKGRGETRYPEGNEALYFEAFLQRMTHKLADDVEKFRLAHTEMINEARKTLLRWAVSEPEIASERVGTTSATPTRLEWIDYRYRIEANARDVFISLCRVLREQAEELDWAQLSETAQTSLKLYREGVALIGDGDSWGRLTQPSIWFCRIQAGMSLLQLWLCWRQVASQTTPGASTALHDFESELEPIVSGLWQPRDELGKLLPLLAGIYAKKTGRASKWQQFRILERNFRVSFAAIDHERFGWLSKLWHDGGEVKRSTV